MELGTVSSVSIIGMIFTLIIAIGLPVVLLILVHKKAKAALSSFLIGCAVFVVFALVLEQFLHTAVFAAAGPLLSGNIVLYGLYGGLAAALFEETGRLVAMKYVMKRNLNRQNALMYGVGHGGIEAILLVGFTYISNLATSIAINSGALQNSLSLLDEGTLEMTLSQIRALWELPAWQFYLAGVERASAIVLQIALSILVYMAVKTGFKRFWLLALGIHFAVDFLVVVIAGYGVPLWAVEIILIIIVLIVALYARKQYRSDQEPSEVFSEPSC